MAHADFSTVTSKVRETIDGSVLAPQIVGVSVDENTDEGGGEFLRIFLTFRNLKALDFDRIEDFVRQIENSVAEVDDRFASVRLAEAA